MEPQAYCDEIAEKFKETWKRVGISNDDFIRTTEPRHKAAVAEMWKRLVAAGDIYEAEYDGMYCVGCETAKTEDDVDHRERPEGLQDPPHAGRAGEGEELLLPPVEVRAEAARVVRADAVARAARVAPQRGARVRRERPARSLGLAAEEVGRAGASPSPAIPSTSIYVWIDALTNYLTVLGGPEAVARGDGQGGVLGGVAPPDRQGHPALPRRLLAGDADERGPAAAEADLLPRLPDREGAEDLEVDAGDQGRPERDRRRAGRRSAALLRAARVHAGRATATSPTRRCSSATSPTWATTSATC